MKSRKISMYTTEEIRSIRTDMVREMSDASRGEETSLVFARHEMADHSRELPVEAQVLVIGGSNFSCSKVKITSQQVEIIETWDSSLPVISDRDVFISLIDEYIAEKPELICINFAYPLSPATRGNRIDGILIKGTKDHVFNGLVGEKIGETVENIYRKKFNMDSAVLCANDTVCLVLAGLGRWKAGSLAGGVIGTGFNFGFIADGSTVINLESGNFNRFRHSDTGMIIDEDSTNRGLQALEKEVSGAYLYRHYNIYAEKFGFPRRDIGSTRELAAIAAGSGDGAECARNLFERSASLVSALIAAIHDFKDGNELNVIIEGSLFWKGWKYRESVDEHLRRLGIPDGRISIHGMENSSIIGGARLWS